jgi:hypothetical protein
MTTIAQMNYDTFQSGPPSKQVMWISFENEQDALYGEALALSNRFQDYTNNHLSIEPLATSKDFISKLQSLQRKLKNFTAAHRDYQDRIGEISVEINAISQQTAEYNDNPLLAKTKHIASEFFTSCCRESCPNCMFESTLKAGVIICCPLICCYKCIVCIAEGGGNGSGGEKNRTAETNQNFIRRYPHTSVGGYNTPLGQHKVGVRYG